MQISKWKENAKLEKRRKTTVLAEKDLTRGDKKRKEKRTVFQKKTIDRRGRGQEGGRQTAEGGEERRCRGNTNKVAQGRPGRVQETRPSKSGGQPRSGSPAGLPCT